MSDIVIGILTVPLSPGSKYYKVCGDGYIAEAHINWLEKSNINVIPIPYDTKKYKFYFNRINGLYLPSGGVFASNSLEYYNCCKKFLQLAIESNNNNIYFPIWGGCMGMQQMMIIADGLDNMDFLDRFDSFNNLLLPLNINENKSSKLLNYLKKNNSKFLHKLKTKKCTLNNHMMGISPSKFKKSKLLNSMYNIISWNYDRQGKPFVSTIEAKEYPFYGVQWHPERSDEFKELAKFLYTELSKNTNYKRLKNNIILDSKKIHCMNYSGGIYNECIFYWHNKTSEHNKKLCDVLSLGTPKNNSI